MSGVNEFGVSVIYQNFSFDIKLLHCGFEQDPNHIMINKRIDRYTLSYITEGEGYYTIKDRYYTLNKGDVYFIPPSYVYSQRINKKNKYKYIYVSISGTSAQMLLQRCGFTSDTPIQQVNNPFIEEKFRQIYELCCESTFSSIAKANVKFFEILCYFIERIDKNNQRQKFAKSELVERAQNYIEANYFADLTVEKIAKHCYCNKSYLSKVFKNICNLSLIEYLTNYRIEKAMDMLINSNFSAYTISEKVGFKDYPNFYRHFKRKTGFSPKVYRRENLRSLEAVYELTPSKKN